MRPAGLDNAVWAALTGAQADLAERVGRAVRYPTELSIFAALDDPMDLDAWDDLARLVGPGGQAVLTRDAFVPPPSWGVAWQGRGMQMVATGAVGAPRPTPDVEVVELGEADAVEMADLVARTDPGPWRPRTWTLGPYLGVRAGEALVAMAGTRMHPAPYREISAVCTDPAHRGRGLAGLLVTALAGRIAGQGEIPFLHTALTNTGARRLYAALGFEESGPVGFGVYDPPGARPRSADAGDGEEQGGADPGEAGR